MNPLQYAQKAILVNEFTGGQYTASFASLASPMASVLSLAHCIDALHNTFRSVQLAALAWRNVCSFCRCRPSDHVFAIPSSVQ